MIILASDHAGFELKEKIKAYLKNKDIDFFDIGASSFEKDDSYVDYGKKAVEYFVQNCNADADRLFLICGSGIGMSIVANRNSRIRAVLACCKKQAEQGRQHNNCNCLCVGARNTSFSKAKKILEVFLKTEFLGGKHLERINSI